MNGSYNQFNGMPRRYQEDGGRGAGVASGLAIGGSLAGIALYGGEMYQGRINGKYNTRIDALNSSKAGRMQQAADPFTTRATSLNEMADLNDSQATNRARRAGRNASGGVAPSQTTTRQVRNINRMNPRGSSGREVLTSLVENNSAAGRDAATASIERSRQTSQNLRSEAGNMTTRGQAAADAAGRRVDRAVGRMEGMRDNHWINRTMNSGTAKFLGGSGRRKAATIATTAVLGSILGGAMDNPNS